MSADESEPPLIALVMLLSKPHRLTEDAVRQGILNAWGLELGSDPDDEGDWLVSADKVNPDFNSAKGQSFLLSTHGRTYLVNSSNNPYMENPERFAQGYADLRLQNAVGRHRAWISADVFGDPPSEEDKPAVYAALGRLLVEFDNDDCLALYCPELERLNEYGPELVQALQSARPLDLFENPTQPPVVGLDPEDPRLVAAVEEMRQRWPEFVAAFRANRNRENIFAVKACFTDGGENEFMWVAVHRIDDNNSITGHVDNEPALVKHVKEGDIVTVPLDSLNDWIFVIDEETTGGFTLKVMDQIENPEPE